MNKIDCGKYFVVFNHSDDGSCVAEVYSNKEHNSRHFEGKLIDTSRITQYDALKMGKAMADHFDTLPDDDKKAAEKKVFKELIRKQIIQSFNEVKE